MENTCGKPADASQFRTSRDVSWFLGCGGCGEIRKCLYKGKPVVVKRLICKRQSETRLQRELKIHSRIQDSSHIVKLYGLVKWLKFTALILEYVARGNFLDILTSEEKYKILPWGVRLKVLCNIADALIHLHKNCGNREFIHGDVKSENVLITEDFSAKLSDFGATNTRKVATYCNFDSIDVKRTTQHTSYYIPPELLKDNKQERTVKTDVYSFGCLVYEAITRIPVFSDANRPCYIVELNIQKGQKPNDERIDSARLKLTNDKERFVFQQLLKIYEKCISFNANDRPNLCEVRQELQSVCDEYGQDLIREETHLLQQQHPVKNNDLQQNNQALLSEFRSDLREVDVFPDGVTNQSYTSEEHTLESQSISNDEVPPQSLSKTKTRVDTAQLLAAQESVACGRQSRESQTVTISSIHDAPSTSTCQPKEAFSPFTDAENKECCTSGLFLKLRRLRCCSKNQGKATISPVPL